MKKYGFLVLSTVICQLPAGVMIITAIMIKQNNEIASQIDWNSVLIMFSLSIMLQLIATIFLGSHEKVRLRVVVNDEELTKTYKDYVNLLSEEIRELIPLASNHGWESSRYEQGETFRKMIKALSNE